MATPTVSEESRWIRRGFDNFQVLYHFFNVSLRGELPKATCEAQINCLNGKEIVAVLKFYEESQIPTNLLVQGPGDRAGDNRLPEIHFQISRFNDIINILRYQKPLSIHIDSYLLMGSLEGDFESVGQQE